MPERLREREEGLPVGDVPPQPERDPVRGQRAVGERPEDALLAAVVEVEPLGDQRAVPLLDRVAVPGSSRTRSSAAVARSESR